MKSYLIALQINAVKQDEIYSMLPLHCTVVHWFNIDMTDEVIKSIQQTVSDMTPVTLCVEKEETFTGHTKTGDLPVTVNKVKKTLQLSELHEALATMLESHGVVYVMPQYIHGGYVPHITHQGDEKVTAGDEMIVSSVFIAEADEPEYGNDRKVIAIL